MRGWLLPEASYRHTEYRAEPFTGSLNAFTSVAAPLAQLHLNWSLVSSTSSRISTEEAPIWASRQPEAGVVAQRGRGEAGTVSRAILAAAADSVAQMLPSGPAVIVVGRLEGEGSGNSVMVPVGVIRLMSLPDPPSAAPPTVNHRFPSGPAVMPAGKVAVAEIRTSVMVLGAPGTMRPTLLAELSVNQRLPSAPAVMNCGELLAVGKRNSVMIPVGVIRPILFPLSSTNHRFHSGPDAMPRGWLLAVNGNSVKDCASACPAPSQSASRVVAATRTVTRE